jgi:hypothetical protein
MTRRRIKPPTYVVTLRAGPGDSIQSLRRLLKYAGRYLNLRAIDAREVTRRASRRRSVAEKPKRAVSNSKRRVVMDMTRFASSRFIKLDDLADGPLLKIIKEIGEGKFEKPVAVFTDGTRASLNGTSVATLIAAFGADDSDWIGREVEVSAGTVADKAALLVLPLTPPAAAKRMSQPDSEIPY